MHCCMCYLQDLVDSQDLLVRRVSLASQEQLDQLELLVALDLQVLLDSLVYQEAQATQEGRVTVDKLANKVLRELLGSLVQMVGLDSKDLLETQALLVHL